MSTPPLDGSGNVDRNNNEMQQKRQNNVIFSRYKLVCQKSPLAFSRLNNSGLCAKFSAKSTSCDAFLATLLVFPFARPHNDGYEMATPSTITLHRSFTKR
jgi:hypothetical protein